MPNAIAGARWSRMASEVKSRETARAADTNTFFYLGVFLYVFSAVLNMSYFSEEVFSASVLYYPVVALLLLNELLNLTRSMRSESILAALLVVLVIVLQLVFGGETIITLALLVFCSRNADYRVAAKAMALGISLSALLVVVLACLGVITNTVEYRYVSSTVRLGLGFLGRTYLSYIVLSVAMLEIVRKREVISWSELVVLFVVNAAVFAFTDTRASFLCAIVCLLIAILNKKLLRFRTSRVKHEAAYEMTYIACALASYALVLLYDPHSEFWLSFDSFVSYRLRYSAATLDLYGLAPFGMDIDWTETSIVDCSYLRFAMDCGWVPLILMLAVMTYVNVRAARMNDRLVLILSFICAVHFLVDPLIGSITFNPLILLSVNKAYTPLHCKGDRVG